MTEDFKEKTLSYLCGKLEIGNKGEDINWEELKSTTNNLYDYLEAEFNPNFEIIGQVQSQGFIVIYGNYGDYGELNKGFLVILNSEYIPIKKITKYKSGTDINTIQRLNVDENNNFYMLEIIANRYRFNMLNNFLVTLTNEYEVILKKSYFLPSSYSLRTIDGDGITQMKKVPGMARYLFGFKLYKSAAVYYPIVLELKLNVGTENDWIEHKDINTYGNYKLSDLYCTGTNDLVKFRLAYVRFGNDGSSSTGELVYDGSNIITRNVKENDALYLKYLDDNFAYSSGVDYDYSNDKVTYSIYIVNLSHGTISKIWEFVFDMFNYGPHSVEGINLLQVDGEFFFNYIYGLNKTNYGVGIGKIVGTKVYTKFLKECPVNDTIALNLFYISKTYNLYNYYFQNKNEVHNVKQIYNISNYNGSEYTDVDSLVPTQGILINNQNEIIFARNLYNKTISGRTTQSTIEVPNIYLNDDIISKEDLLGKTNSILISNNQTITKNIYETLNINFINALQIRNDNDESNSILNPIGASRLNNSISNLADYENAKMSKYRINYSDNTNRIINNIWAPIGNFYRTIINIYVNKEIKSIDFISDDENTIYCSISPILEINKIYKIKQDVYIDEKIQPNEVLYNNEEVFYNDEKVYY